VNFRRVKNKSQKKICGDACKGYAGNDNIAPELRVSGPKIKNPRLRAGIAFRFPAIARNLGLLYFAWHG
jgi:hypothetical protein